MYKFSRISSERLATCHPDLQVLFNEVIKYFDCSVLCGHRGREEQEKAFSEGKSKLRFPQSKHNSTPSMAVDVAPFPIDWNDLHRFYYFAGRVMGIADMLLAQNKISHRIRFGGDWNSDNQVKDNRFNDLVHFELVK